VITGILLRLLQAHFADSDNIRDEGLRHLHWHEDPAAGPAIQSNILVAPLYKYDPRTIQLRPAVLVFRQAVKADKLPLESRTLTSLNASGNFTGDKYTVPVSGIHVVRYIAETAFASERLGEEVFYRLLEYFPAIKQDFPFSDLSITDLNEPKKVQEDTIQAFAADIAVRWVHMHGWTLKPIAPILKKVRYEEQAV